MKLTIENNEEDYINTQIFMLNNTTLWAKKQKKTIIIAAYVIFITIGILFSLMYFTNGNILNILIAIFSILVAFLYPRSIDKTYTRNFKKHYQLIKDDGDLELFIDKNQFLLSTPIISTQMKTKDIYKFYETDNYFFIQITKTSTIYIPKISLKNIDEIRKEINEYYSEYNIEYISI